MIMAKKTLTTIGKNMIRRSARTDPSAGQVTLGDYIEQETKNLEQEEKSLGQIAYETYHSLANPNSAYPWSRQSNKIQEYWTQVAVRVIHASYHRANKYW